MGKCCFVLVFLSLLVFTGCSSDDKPDPIGTGNAAPRITGFSPGEVNPGQQEIEGRVFGTDFVNVTSVSLGDFVSVENFSAISATEIYVFFSVFPNAPSGPSTIRVATISGSGESTSVLQIGSNRSPDPTFSVSPSKGFLATDFRFDASGSRDDGRIVDYHWNFGDGRSDKGKTVTHQFRSTGFFIVELKITDNENLISKISRTLDVDGSKPPIARFISDPESGSTETKFRFDGSSSRDPDGQVRKYSWSFGDGTTGTGEKVEHQYSITGGMPVTLTVTDNTAEYSFYTRIVTVKTDGGGGGGGGGACTTPARNRDLIFGTVVGVEGFTAIVQFPEGTTCKNAFYQCGDMRKASPEQFYGIVRAMSDLGNGKFTVLNDCPFQWPPQIGETIFLIYKSCSNNFCP